MYHFCGKYFRDYQYQYQYQFLASHFLNKFVKFKKKCEFNETNALEHGAPEYTRKGIIANLSDSMNFPNLRLIVSGTHMNLT